MISQPSHTEYFNFLVESAAKNRDPKEASTVLVESILNDAITRLIDIKFIILAFKKLKVLDVPELDAWLNKYLQNLDELIVKASRPSH